VTPFSLLLVLGGWVMIWTGIKGDGRGGYNPLHVISDAASGRSSGSGMGGDFATGDFGGGNMGAPGVYEDFGPWDDPDGNHQTHAHFAADPALVIRAGRALQQLGFTVTGHPLFLPIGGHTEGSYHYTARAIDYNWPGPDERAHLARGRAVILGLTSGGSAKAVA
jgi:hypothetical protein